jgi:hypothetical protein
VAPEFSTWGVNGYLESYWVDGGYPNVDVLLSSQEMGFDMSGPTRCDASRQAKMEGGYAQSKFVID